MRFAPEYVTYVLNENFEDAKELLLAPLMAIDYAHLVMVAGVAVVLFVAFKLPWIEFLWHNVIGAVVVVVVGLLISVIA